MKLGALNTAIKAADNVKVEFSFGSVALQKTSLMDALKTHFTDGRSQETNLTITPEGYLNLEVMPDGVKVR